MAFSGTSSRNTWCPPRFRALAICWASSLALNGPMRTRIIFSCWPIAWGEIGLLTPGLQLAEYLLSLLTLLERSPLYLKEGCFVWTGLLRFRWLFRDCHSYRADSLLNQPYAVSGRLR